MAIRYYDIGHIAFIQQDFEIPLVRIYGNGLILGILVGIPYSIMEAYLKNKGLYKYSLARIMINRTAIQFIITAAVLLGISYVNFFLDVEKGNIDGETTGFRQYVFSATVQFLFLGAFIGNLILGIFRLCN